MHCVIQLNLGREVEDQIRSLWHALADYEINPERLSETTPHVTVTSSTPFPLNRVTKDLARIAKQSEPFEIAFSHLGVFQGKPMVLFLGVTHTAALTSLHRRLYDLISRSAEVFDFARPDVSVFHCTLGYFMQATGLSSAVEVVLDASLPREVPVRGFDVVEYGETPRVLTSYALGESGAD